MLLPVVNFLKAEILFLLESGTFIETVKFFLDSDCPKQKFEIKISMDKYFFIEVGLNCLQRVCTRLVAVFKP